MNIGLWPRLGFAASIDLTNQKCWASTRKKKCLFDPRRSYWRSILCDCRCDLEAQLASLVARCFRIMFDQCLGWFRLNLCLKGWFRSLSRGKICPKGSMVLECLPDLLKQCPHRWIYMNILYIEHIVFGCFEPFWTWFWMMNQFGIIWPFVFDGWNQESD